MNNNLCICDFHSHILPSIDDGAKDTSMAVTLLKEEIEQGVKHLCLTPHFYSNENVESFIKKRNLSFLKLKEQIYKENIKNVPNMHLGAEVALNYTTPEIPDLNKLCLGDTELLLLEMPDTFWGDWIPEVLYRISAEKSLTPIIAHADRYIDNKNSIKILQKLIDMDIIMQFNSYNLTHPKVVGLIKKILARNVNTPLIGSDAHNTKYRSVTIKKVSSPLHKILYGKNFINNINSFSESILIK